MARVLAEGEYLVTVSDFRYRCQTDKDCGVNLCSEVFVELVIDGSVEKDFVRRGRRLSVKHRKTLSKKSRRRRCREEKEIKN